MLTFEGEGFMGAQNILNKLQVKETRGVVVVVVVVVGGGGVVVVVVVESVPPEWVGGGNCGDGGDEKHGTNNT